MLLLTLMLMGIPTVLIGTLTDLRINWILGCNWLGDLAIYSRYTMGGEWGGAVLMAVEHAPEGGKGFWGSLPQASTGGA